MEWNLLRWMGVQGSNLMRRYTQTKSASIRAWIEQFMSMRPCSSCGGARLRKETLSVTLGQMNIGEISAMSVFELN